MTVFKDAFRKAGRNDWVDEKESFDKEMLASKIFYLDAAIKQLQKDRNDAMQGYDIARQHRNHFAKTVKEGTKEYLAGILDPLNQNVWKAGLTAKFALVSINRQIVNLEHKREQLRKGREVENEIGWWNRPK